MSTNEQYNRLLDQLNQFKKVSSDPERVSELLALQNLAETIILEIEEHMPDPDGWKENEDLPITELLKINSKKKK